MPTNALSDFLSILFRALFRLEVEGRREPRQCRPQPDHRAQPHELPRRRRSRCRCADRKPVFAIDSAIAQHWWVKPFLKLTRAMPLDPTKPMATRTLINAVKGGEPLIIFPEGRITVTGSLMKIYDGAALIADKIRRLRGAGADRGPGADAVHAAVQAARCGAAGSPRSRSPCWSRSSSPSIRRSRASYRRQAAGAALYEIMSDLVFRTTSIERTVCRGADRGGRGARPRPRRGRGPDVRRAELPQAPHGRAIARRQADAARARGRRDRRDAAERQRRGGDLARR